MTQDMGKEQREALARDLDETRRLIYIALAASNPWVREARLYELVGTLTNALAHHANRRKSATDGAAILVTIVSALGHMHEGGQALLDAIDGIQGELDELDAQTDTAPDATAREVASMTAGEDAVEQIMALIIDRAQTGGAPDLSRCRRIVTEIIGEYDSEIERAGRQLGVLCAEMLREWDRVGRADGTTRWRERMVNACTVIGIAS